MTAEERATEATQMWCDIHFQGHFQTGLRIFIRDAITEAVAEERNKTHNELTNLRNSGPTFRPNNLKEWEHGWDCGVEDAAAAIREVKP